MRNKGRETTLGQPRVRNSGLAYKGLGDIVPLYSRAESTAPITCFALCAFLTGVVTTFFISYFLVTEHFEPILIPDEEAPPNTEDMDTNENHDGVELQH